MYGVIITAIICATILVIFFCGTTGGGDFDD